MTNRSKILSKLSELYDHRVSHLDSKFEDEIELIDEVFNYIRDSIDLAELLQWEENVSYCHPDFEDEYMIKNNNLYRLINNRWVVNYELLCTNYKLNKLSEFNKVDQKYYLKLMFLDDTNSKYSYLNYNKQSEAIFIYNKCQRESIKTTFTDEEIDKLVVKYSIPHGMFKKVKIQDGRDEDDNNE